MAPSSFLSDLASSISCKHRIVKRKFRRVRWRRCPSLSVSLSPHPAASTTPIRRAGACLLPSLPRSHQPRAGRARGRRDRIRMVKLPLLADRRRAGPVRPRLVSNGGMAGDKLPSAPLRTGSALRVPCTRAAGRRSACGREGGYPRTPHPPAPLKAGAGPPTSLRVNSAVPLRTTPCHFAHQNGVILRYAQDDIGTASDPTRKRSP